MSGLLIGSIGILCMAGFAACLALIIRRLFRNWASQTVISVASALAPASIIVVFLLLAVGISIQDQPFTGPEAQGLLVFGIAASLMSVLGWRLGGSAARAELRDGRTE